MGGWGGGGGWGALGVCFGGGPRDGARSVVFEHCTIAGEGMLQVEGFSERSPIRLDVSSCVVKVGRLLDWKPSPPDAPCTPRALAWTGSQNQLEIAGDAWLDGPGVPAVPSLETWEQQYVERDPIRVGVRFSMAPETPDGRLTPAAYALVNAPTPAPGAGPGDVGPASAP